MSDTDAATAEAAARAKSYRDSLESLRSRTDAAAKALAGLGTAGLTAIGIEKVADVFPYPDGGWPFLVSAALGFFVMIGVLCAFAVRLHRASAPLSTSSDPTLMTDDETERETITAVYQRTARLNEKGSLAAYEAEAHALELEADRKPDGKTRKALQERAARIRAEIRATQASAAHKVISDRLHAALAGRAARYLAVAFLIALLTFGVSTDRLGSERTGEAAALKGCADALEAKVPADVLPNFCDAASPPRSDPGTAGQQAAARMSDLAALYSTCVDTAAKDEQPLSTCDSIKARLRATLR